VKRVLTGVLVPGARHDPEREAVGNELRMQEVFAEEVRRESVAASEQDLATIHHVSSVRVPLSERTHRAVVCS
jgi:hypothetical protein